MGSDIVGQAANIALRMSLTASAGNEVARRVQERCVQAFEQKLRETYEFLCASNAVLEANVQRMRLEAAQLYALEAQSIVSRSKFGPWNNR
jgi:hypothetical protein